MMDMGFSVVIIIIIVIINNINIAPNTVLRPQHHTRHPSLLGLAFDKTLLIPFGKMSLESVFQNVWERLDSSLD